MLRGIWSAIASAMTSWYQAKLFVEHSLAVSPDSIHVVVGVLALLVVSLLTRRSIASWRPWLVLLVIELLNEAIDLWIEQWPDPGMQYGEGARDLLLTMLLPTVLLLAVRLRPDLFRGPYATRRR
ncbi:MAG: hypothetical protein ACJ8FL_00830 [Sphingomicrobium sp.]